MAKIRENIEDFTPDPRVVDERGPTRQRLDRSNGHHEAGDVGRVTMRDCPLERAVRKHIIESDQYNAGMKFRHHWFHSGQASSIGSMDLNRVFGGNIAGGPLAKTERQLFHRQQYIAACEKVGLRTEKILADVICWELPLAEIGNVHLGMKSRQSAEIAVKALFINGLDMLVQLWGLRTK